MPVEILTVSLSDDSIEALANAVARLIRNQIQPGNYPAAESNPPSSETHRTRSDQVPQQGGDSWGETPVDDGGWPQGGQSAQPPQQSQPPQQNQQQGGPKFCQHGEMRLVPAGFSQSSGKAYKAFYACPTPRGATDKCKSITA